MPTQSGIALLQPQLLEEVSEHMHARARKLLGVAHDQIVIDKAEDVYAQAGDARPEQSGDCRSYADYATRRTCG